MRNLCSAAAISICFSIPAAAATIDVGQPFLVAEGGLSGSILDYFDTFGPSGVKLITLNGFITEAFGAAALVGANLAFSTTVVGSDKEASLTLGTTTLSGLYIYDSFGYDPFQPSGPGDMNFLIGVSPNYTELSYNPATMEGTFTYSDDFAAFGPRTQEFPEFELLLSIYLDGPLPTKTYEAFDPLTGALIYTTDYIEGPLSISRMTLGTIGGPAIAVAAVPLPTPLLLLVGGLAGLAALRRRRMLI